MTDSGKKLDQGFSAAQQYAALNKAREKRKKRRERNFKQLLNGGYQIPIINAGKP